MRTILWYVHTLRSEILCVVRLYLQWLKARLFIEKVDFPLAFFFLLFIYLSIFFTFYSHLLFFLSVFDFHNLFSVFSFHLCFLHSIFLILATEKYLNEEIENLRKQLDDKNYYTTEGQSVGDTVNNISEVAMDIITPSTGIHIQDPHQIPHQGQGQDTPTSGIQTQDPHQSQNNGRENESLLLEIKEMKSACDSLRVLYEGLKEEKILFERGLENANVQLDEVRTDKYILSLSLFFLILSFTHPHTSRQT